MMIWTSVSESKPITRNLRRIYCAFSKSILQLTIVVIALLNNIAYAQWVKLNTDFVSDVRAFGVNDTNLFAGSEDEGIFLTTNKGESWTAIADIYGVNDFAVSATAEGEITIFAASSDPFSGGVYCSTDNIL
jgi:hypothetical protein